MAHKNREPQNEGGVKTRVSNLDGTFGSCKEPLSEFARAEFDGKDSAVTLAELRMCAASACVREEAGWWEDGKENRNREIIQEWEARQGVQLTENMVNYIMGELGGYAQLRDPESGIESGPYDRIWKCNKPLPDNLHQSLVDAIATLRSAQYLPLSSGSERTHLLDPLLLPFIHGRTHDTNGVIIDHSRYSFWGMPLFHSKRFRMLPSDFRVDTTGGVTLVSPYINGLYVDAPHSPGALVQEGICALVERALPMFERVLSDLGTTRDFLRRYVPKSVPGARMKLGSDNQYPCIWAQATQPPKPPSELPPAEFDVFYAAHLHRCQLPDSKPAYDGALGPVKRTVSLRGRDVQIAVRISEVSLEAGQASEEESWDLEGAMNDAVVAIFTYCLSSSNIATPTIAFRNAVRAPDLHGSDPSEAICARELYGLTDGAPCAQVVGHAPLKTGHALCHPHLYQTRLSAPSSADPLVYLELLLIDPSYSPIGSTSAVLVQDALWVRRALAAAGVWARLPTELWDIIFGLVPSLISPADARQFHAEILAEREEIQRAVNTQRFELPFHIPDPVYEVTTPEGASPGLLQVALHWILRCTRTYIAKFI